MERQYENHNVNYFTALLNHRDMVIRTRAVCILADISTESVVRDIGTVLRTDMEPLVRHEAAHSPWDSWDFLVQSKHLPTPSKRMLVFS